MHDSVARWWEREPRPEARLAAALALAGLAVFAFWAHTQWGPHYVHDTAADLSGPLEGARRILRGERNIYARLYAPYATEYPLSYPLTTSFFVLPLAWLAPRTAGMTFVAVTTMASAYVLSRRRLSDLLLFLSAPAVFSWAWAQWSPLFLLQGLTTWSVILAIAKPQIGAVMFAYRPSWRGLAIAVAAALATLLWSPTWPYRWLNGSLHDPNEVKEHLGALFAPGGFTLLLAALKWRDPRARMLLALTVIPERLGLSEQLCLGLIPETTRRRVIWVLCSWLAAAGWQIARMVTGGEADTAIHTLIVFLVYWPALVFILKPIPAPTST